MPALKAGERAPVFELPDHASGTTRLGDYLGKKKVVLAFFVRASTPG
jgi:peroxiredoxin